MPDARVPIWDKFVYLAPFSGFTGAARLPIGPLCGSCRTCARCSTRRRSEVAAIAAAEGVPDLDRPVRHAREYMDGIPPTTRSSLLIDLEQGKRIEVEALQGAAVRRAAALGVPAPILCRRCTRRACIAAGPPAGRVPTRAPARAAIGSQPQKGSTSRRRRLDEQPVDPAAAARTRPARPRRDAEEAAPEPCACRSASARPSASRSRRGPRRPAAPGRADGAARAADGRAARRARRSALARAWRPRCLRTARLRGHRLGVGDAAPPLGAATGGACATATRRAWTAASARAPAARSCASRAGALAAPATSAPCLDGSGRRLSSARRLTARAADGALAVGSARAACAAESGSSAAHALPRWPARRRRSGVRDGSRGAVPSHCLDDARSTGRPEPRVQRLHAGLGGIVDAPLVGGRGAVGASGRFVGHDAEDSASAGAMRVPRRPRRAADARRESALQRRRRRAVSARSCTEIGHAHYRTESAARPIVAARQVAHVRKRPARRQSPCRRGTPIALDTGPWWSRSWARRAARARRRWR